MDDLLEVGDGTHPAAEIWEKLRVILGRIGVTRIADITWLDEVGIPCAQAIRPEARTLSISQGRGATRAQAFISAAMEAVEVWHAENLGPAPITRTIAEMRDLLTYPVTSLRVNRRSYLNGGTRLGWLPGVALATGRPQWIPEDAVRLDSVVEPSWNPILFDTTSNGLAGGATIEDAVLHGLLEVIERDALARSQPHRRRRVRLTDLPDQAARLVDQFHQADIDVTIEFVPSPVRIPCFAVKIFSDDYPVDFCGSAADGIAEDALSRALTEAAQSRLAAIAGTREDFDGSIYRVERTPLRREKDTQRHAIDFAAIELEREPCDVSMLTGRLMHMTGYSPIVLDHSRDDIAIPIVRVVCPGMKCPEDY